jgi:hypothetical protein
MTLLSSGCVYVPLRSLPQFTSAQLASGSATVRVEFSFQNGGYRSQASILPYTAADVHHVVVRVFKLTGATEIPVADTRADGQPLVLALDRASIDAGVALTRLAHNTTYRVRVRAYKAAGEAAADLISDEQASVAEIVVGQDDRPVTGAIAVKLIDRLFVGQATPSLDFAPGKVIDAGPEIIE